MAVKKKKGLGRGLDALIAPAAKDENSNTTESKSTKPLKQNTAPEQIVEKIVEVPVEKIVEKIIEKPVIIEKPAELMVKIDEVEPNRSQPRQTFDEEALQELAESIKSHGIIQPLIVQKEDDFYKIIAGERRWRAARLAGLSEVPVIVKDYSPMESVEVALIENIQREDLNPIEEAIAFQKLINEFGLKQDEAAEKVSKSRTAITNALRLLKLDDRVKQMIIDEMISSGHGRTLLAIEDKELQYTTAMKIFDNKLSVRETERLVKKMLSDTPEKKSKIDPQLEVIYHGIEDKIKSIVGTKVSINAKSSKKGKIEIEYYSEDDLERIVGLLESIH